MGLRRARSTEQVPGPYRDSVKKKKSHPGPQNEQKYYCSHALFIYI